MTDRTIIGQRIAELRKQKDLTQAELADMLGVTHQAVSQWERSETLPDILTLPKIAQIFGEDINAILGLEEPKGSAESGADASFPETAGEAAPGDETEKAGEEAEVPAVTADAAADVPEEPGSQPYPALNMDELMQQFETARKTAQKTGTASGNS